MPVELNGEMVSERLWLVRDELEKCSDKLNQFRTQQERNLSVSQQDTVNDVSRRVEMLTGLLSDTIKQA